MVAHGPLTSHRVDFGFDLLTDDQLAALESAVVTKDVGLDLLRVVDVELHPVSRSAAPRSPTWPPDSA